jgi:hypothetical protein
MMCRSMLGCVAQPAVGLPTENESALGAAARACVGQSIGLR